MVLVIINKDGKAELILNVQLKGSVENPWDPVRVKIKFEDFGDHEIKVFSMKDKQLRDLLEENNVLIVYPEPTVVPKPPEITVTEVKHKKPPTHVTYVSSVKEKCGIATYTRFLSSEMEKLFPVKVVRHMYHAEPDAMIHCFPGDTRIMTSRGLIPIREVRVGDMVISHTGEPRRVKHVFKRQYSGPLIVLKITHSSKTISLTPEHPILAIRYHWKSRHLQRFMKSFYQRGYESYREKRNVFKVEWIKAKDIKKGDILLFPRLKEKSLEEIKITDFIKLPKLWYLNGNRIEGKNYRSNPIPNTIKINKELMRLIGYYLSEGCSNNSLIRFTFNIHETKYIDDVILIMKKLFNLTPHIELKYEKNSCTLTYGSRILATFFGKLFGKKAREKKIPFWMLFLSRNLLSELVKAMWRGDGSMTTDHYSIATYSLELRESLRLIFAKLGLIPNVYEQSVRVTGADLHVANQILEAEHPYSKKKRKKKKPYSFGWLDEKYLYYPVKDVTVTTFNGYVYNLEVEKDNSYVVQGITVHNCQHEFGIFPYVDELVGERFKSNYKVVTWHTVVREPVGEMLRHYHTLDRYYDAHIVHNYLAKKYLSAYTNKPIYVIPHGSLLFDPLPRDKAREMLSLPKNRKIVFSFGFMAESKGFEEIAEVARRMKDTLFIISGAIHDLLVEHGLQLSEKLRKIKPDNVIVLGKYLSEEEINRYASASDVLLFNYKTPSFVSSASGAMHRVIAAGKPVVCTYDNRLIELEDGVHALKYRQGDVEAMINCLNLVFEDRGLASTLGENARRLAEKTSWRKVAKMHFDVYGKIVGEFFNEKWYDEEYFAGTHGGKLYVTLNGKTKRWSYFNPRGIWEGCEPVAEAWIKLFKPKNALDVGCGQGCFVAALRKHGVKAEGFDFSKYALEHHHPECKKEWLKLHDATKPWPYKDKSFDLVVCLDFYEHIYEEDLPKVLDEMFRVARKWIFLQIAVVGGGSGAEIHHKGFSLRKGQLPPKELLPLTVAGHVNVRTRKYWRRKLKRGGWRFRDDLVDEFFKLVPDKYMVNWKQNLILVLERM